MCHTARVKLWRAALGLDPRERAEHGADANVAPLQRANQVRGTAAAVGTHAPQAELPPTSTLATTPVTPVPLQRTQQLIEVLAQRMDGWRLDERPSQDLWAPNETAESLAALERAATALADQLEKATTQSAMTGSARAELAEQTAATHWDRPDLTTMVRLCNRPALLRAAQKIDYALADGATIEERVRQELVEPLVGRVQVRPGQSWAGALDATLSSDTFPGPYTAQLKGELASARAACKRAGLDFSKLFEAQAAEVSTRNSKLGRSSTAEIFADCERPLAEDVVLYSWQSPDNAAALVEDASAHWASVAKSGVYWCESPVRTSGYRGGSEFGAMVEVRLPRGTVYADVSAFTVKNELGSRHAYHNHALTPEGVTKPLNRYNRSDGWWQMPARPEFEFRAFDPSKLPTRQLTLMIAEAEPSGLPFLVEAMNDALLARGERTAGGLAPALERSLQSRLERKLDKWTQERRSGAAYSRHVSDVLDLLNAMLEIGERHPDIRAQATTAIAGFGPVEREALKAVLSLREGPPPKHLSKIVE
jgi:hypothetical protein